MKLADFQALFMRVFASEAEAGTITYPLPQDKPSAGRVGVRQGFPLETMTPIAAGGLPPHGADLNGILRMLSASCQRGEAGVILPFSADFASLIGGYPRNALVTYGAESLFYLSLSDENQSVPGTPGAQWRGLLEDVVTTPSSATADIKIRFMVMQPATDNAADILRVVTLSGSAIDMPSLAFLEARLTDVVRSAISSDQERLVRLIRANSVSDARGGFVVVIDQDGRQLTLTSSALAQNIAEAAAAAATADCVRSHPDADAAQAITALSGFENADAKGPLVAAEGKKGTDFRLPSVPYVMQMILEGAGLKVSRANPGYSTLPGGVVLQWGFYKTDNMRGMANVEFPMVFPSTCAAVILCESAAQGTWFNSTPTVHGVFEGWTPTGFIAVTRLFTAAGQNVPHEASGSYLAIGF
ncbi:hypothetical protein CGLAMM_10800 [Acetobacteraceae bacterium EV16G]|uniref:gp53-like domain-containing protein n=1 Tax=Sorlinia euscelidii TaxID=3081148 RepID=UPI002F3A52C3